jgi:hypothetical protein
MFCIDMLFTVMGIWADLSGINDIAYSLVTTWQWDTVANLLTGDVWGFIWLLIDIGWSVLTNYIAKLDWFTKLFQGAQWFAEFISQEWVINLVALAISIASGLLSIWQSCY